MSPTTRPGSSGKCREVRQDHSFRDSTCAWGPGISGKAGRGEPGAHQAALLMVLSSVPCNLGIQPPQGPRPPLGPHITDHHTCHKQAASSYSGPLQKGYQCPPQLMGRYWQGGKVGNRYLKSPAVQSKKAGCLTMGSQRLRCCWVEPLPQHCQTKQRQWSFRAWGRGSNMQESGQFLPQGLFWYLELVACLGATERSLLLQTAVPGCQQEPRCASQGLITHHRLS